MISSVYNVSFSLNKFFKGIKLKKQYIQKLKKKVCMLKNLKEKSYKNIYTLAFPHKRFSEPVFNSRCVMYIIDVLFSKTNTLLHIMDSSGKLKFFYSAGSFKISGKKKKSRTAVFSDLYKVLVSKIKFLRFKPVALHLKNVGQNKFWIISKLKKKFYIKIVRNFNDYPHNGCRKKKKRRKKVRK